MLTALALLAAGLAMPLLAPLLLASGRWQVFRPRLALASWFVAFALGAALTVAALGLTVWTAVATASNAPDALVVSIGAWVGVLGAAAAIGLASGLSEPLVSSYRRSLRRISPIATSRQDRGPFTLVRFDSDEPIAVAVPGRNAEILLSSGLERALTQPQLRAVLAHEYAHLRGRHGFLVRLAEVNAACLPGFLPAGNRFRRATTMLVELVADDTAARQAGTEQVALALEHLADLSGAPGLLVRAERLRALPRAESEPTGVPLPVLV